VGIGREEKELERKLEEIRFKIGRREREVRIINDKVDVEFLEFPKFAPQDPIQTILS